MKESQVWIWGRQPVLEALRSGSVRSILLAGGRKPAPILDEIRRAAHQSGVSIQEVPRVDVDRVARGQNTQGVAARVVERRLTHLEELLTLARSQERAAYLLVLDEIQDPQNLGSLIRTANAAGVLGVVLPERRSAHLSGTVAKVSAGAVSHVPVVEVTNLARALREIREAGIWTVGLDESAPQPFYSIDLTVPLALVVGSEGSGLRRLTRESCDVVGHLPMLGSIESLNAAVAGSIAMYEVVRQRMRVE